MEENFYLNDILSQDTELKRALQYYKTDSVKNELEKLKRLDVKKVIFSGMGSSHFCSYGAGILLKQHGIDSEVISTGELIYYETGSIRKDTILCLISQSGESAEIRHLIEEIDDEVFVIALTNNMDSALGKRGNVGFALNVSDEISVTTRTYVSSLIMTQLIAAALCKEDLEPVYQEYKDTIEKMTSYLKNYEEEVSRLRDFCEGMNSVCLMGRGNALSSVRSGALFLREVSKFMAADFDSAEFRHGPMELVEQGFYGIVFAPSGKTQALGLSLSNSIAEKGGKVILITDESGDKAFEADHSAILKIVLPEACEFASQLLQIIPVQLLANLIAERKGIPAGVFRWGSKITASE